MISHEISIEAIVDEYLMHFPESSDHRAQLIAIVHAMVANQPTHTIDPRASEAIRQKVLQQLMSTQSKQKNIN